MVDTVAQRGSYEGEVKATVFSVCVLTSVGG